MALRCLCDRWVLIGDGRKVGEEDAGGSKRSLSPEAALAAMTVHFDIVDPPAISGLHLLRSQAMDKLRLHPVAGKICSIFEGLFLIDFSCSYRANYDYPWDGRYLAYDAIRNQICTIPPLTLLDSAAVNLGSTAVAVRVGFHGVYFFADLVSNRASDLQAELRMWTTGRELIKKSVPLPFPARVFKVNKTFLLPGSQIFWVDLLAGALVCDLLEPESSIFIPLPMGCQLLDRQDVQNPELYRTMGYVNGTVWFVSVESDNQKFMLKSWILSPDFKRWVEGCWWAVEDIWASRSFKEKGLPRVMPTCPVLSITQEGVIYIVLTEFNRLDYIDPDFEDVNRGGRLEPGAQYGVELDMRQNKVLDAAKRCLADFSYNPELYISEYTGTFDYILPILKHFRIPLDGDYEEGCMAAASSAISVLDFTAEVSPASLTIQHLPQRRFGISSLFCSP